jgi:hypothetical protein
MVLWVRRSLAALAVLVAACSVEVAALPRQRAHPAHPPHSAQERIDTGIAISVNGQTLPRDPAPRIVNGRILVPVAKTYGAIGVTVQRVGDVLTLSAPGQRVVLRLGSDRALIGDSPVTMDAPATTIDGATYVPLRFVAESLRAQATYNRSSNLVEITSSIVGRNPALEQRTDGGAQLVGTVSAVDLNSSTPSITVVRGGARTVSIGPDVQIVLQDVVTRTSVAAGIADVHVGDAVSVAIRNDGRVTEVIARYASRTGKIAAVSPALFVLDSGLMVTPDKSTQITLNAQPATLDELKVGDSVTVRSNPDTNEKRQIIVSRAETGLPPVAPGATTIEAFTVTGKSALRAGDSFTVTLRGTAAGRATYDIGSYVTGIPMTEGAAGVYTARYVVPSDVNFGRTQIAGHLVVAGIEAPRVQAAGLIAISTAPPQIVEVAPSNGATVNNSRPSIYATYRSPTDIGINPSSVSIRVNGLDVTPTSTRTDGFITYSPGVSLNDGTVNVTVSVSDRAGNAQQRSWSFTVRSH